MRIVALTNCVDCGHDLSTLAAACTHCGRPVDQPHRLLTGRNRAVRIASGLVLAYVLAFTFPGYWVIYAIASLVFAGWQLRAYANDRRSRSVTEHLRSSGLR